MELLFYPLGKIIELIPGLGQCIVDFFPTLTDELAGLAGLT